MQTSRFEAEYDNIINIKEKHFLGYCKFRNYCNDFFNSFRIPVKLTSVESSVQILLQSH